ncbi:uncharacterized protein RCO7_07722 [Rhynchosporium graminicola]|uniref:RZ-type domain-containing protein n=2 Tax=Rhynchosporium TaxID=38037 RepID=A0A1E1MJI5_RHYSE|nr:uncharacterized protein RCO7_07722 [Rhynchosporium commune]CZT49237.1 uncharacterized protein RSE6_10050 [Rhynchosporium secalis]
MDVVPYFRRITVDRNQPAQKLHDATVYATMQAAARDLEVGQAMARGPAGSSINNGGGNPTQKKKFDFSRSPRSFASNPFKDADILDEAIDHIMGLLGKEWYEEVTAEELAAIKQAMFAIGECGMPMEQARCIECGARIGGRDHQAVDGVTRAEEMER